MALKRPYRQVIVPANSYVFVRMQMGVEGDHLGLVSTVQPSDRSAFWLALICR
jgi:hypothetical protein